MKKAIVGCTTSYDDERIFHEKIVEPIHYNGASLIFLSHTLDETEISRYVNLVDGILIGGGLEDISPKWFNEVSHTNLSNTDEVRDAFEISLIKMALLKNIPILGICRGPHIINVASGGTIYQDLITQMQKSTLDHLGNWVNSDKHFHYPNEHQIFIKEGSLLFDIIQEKEVTVNSYHHQAIKTLAPNFQASALAGDNIIEAIESIKHKFVLGIQWHAELNWRENKNNTIFARFISAIYDQKGR